MEDDLRVLPNAKERYDFLIDFVKKSTGLDCRSYLRSNFSLDMLACNPDRHFSNLGIIREQDGTFREAPIFDNGQGLGQNFSITSPYLTVEEKRRILTSVSISGSFEDQVLAVGNNLEIDYERLYKILDGYENSKAKDFLLYQLKLYEQVFRKDTSTTGFFT